ncbi:putative ATP-dependent helicase like protein [Verticillium longisporum]|uniref:Putative ATP-dependent helicase like protein n=1 Tax=Verticillium longisporum TaxID=100787 RepID=A0A8I2ZQ90_VERLO|nr:putative ATP-dependent helicase like protein [Verticillium longisporum]
MSGNAPLTNWSDEAEDDIQTRPRVKLPPSNPTPPATSSSLASPPTTTTPAPVTPGPSAMPAPKASAKPKKASSKFEACAVFAQNSEGPVIACDPSMSGMCKVSATFVVCRNRDCVPWVGIRLQFPLGPGQLDNENDGFGVRHVPVADRQNFDKPVVVSDQHTIDIRMQRGQYTWSIDSAPPAIVARFSRLSPTVIEKGVTILTLRLKDDMSSDVVGFGMPYANVCDPELESWVNHDHPIVGGISLLDLVQARKFTLLVDKTPVHVTECVKENNLPPPFALPYGEDHSYNPDRSHDTDNDHLAIVTQSEVQDVFWVEQDAVALRKDKTPVYFVPRDLDTAVEDVRRFFAIMPRDKAFWARYKEAWARLWKDLNIQLFLYYNKAEELTSGIWDAKLILHPKSREELATLHPTTDDDLVFEVWRPRDDNKACGPDYRNCASISFGSQMVDCERKVNAVNFFCLKATPTNAESLMLPKEVQFEEVPPVVLDRMELHRAVLRGKGFFEWMVKPAPVEDNTGLAGNLAAMGLENAPRPEVTKRRQLPIVNFLNIPDGRYVDALLEEALPQDRSRYRRYLSECQLGIGVMTAGPGFGKTTGASIVALAMQSSLGKILVSAPSNIAVGNFAERIDRITVSVAARYNKEKPADNLTRARHRLVVRGFRFRTELAAFKYLLKNPSGGEVAAAGNSKWRLHLSFAYWTFSLLSNGSYIAGTREMHPDEHESLEQIRQRYRQNSEYDNLRALLDGTITYQQYESGDMLKDAKIESVMIAILACVDVLCTTPAATENCEEFKEWKNGHADGIVIDEAANMHRADLYCVWGNTMLPVFLIGDPKQLPPAVMTKDSADADGNLFNRLALDGGISALGFIQASGVPVFRLKCQLRMGKGLFDIIANEIYPDVPFTYGASCDISLPGFSSGRLLEKYIHERFPKVSAPVEGTFSPIFINCPGSRVFTDPRSGSRKCPDQIKVALDFAVDLIKTNHGKAEDIVVLSPYAANVEAIGHMRKKRPEYTAALINMPESSTIDGYQGRENDIVIVVMGTSKSTGPLFTSNENRLNVMFTRQRCGLVVVGELDAVGVLKKGAKDAVVKTHDAEGNLVVTRAAALRCVYRALKDRGRVADVKIERKK